MIEFFRRNKFIRRFLYTLGYSPSGPITLGSIKTDWVVDQVKEMIETWNIEKGENKLLIIYVLGNGHTGKIEHMASASFTGVDNNAPPEEGMPITIVESEGAVI